MKTHHFILKEDGNIYVIPEIGNSKESALLVENQKEVTAKIVELSFAEDSFHPFEFKVGEIYPLECGIEVSSLRGDDTIGYYTKCGRYWCDECCNGDRCDDSTHRNRKDCPYCKGSGFRNFNTVALITFSEPKPSEEQVERQSPPETSQILNEDFKNTMREDATAYVKRQGTHDRPGITKHDYISGYCAAYARYGQPDKDHSSPAHTDNQEEPTQEELWNEVLTFVDENLFKGTTAQILWLSENFTITRKQK